MFSYYLQACLKAFMSFVTNKATGSVGIVSLQVAGT